MRAAQREQLAPLVVELPVVPSDRVVLAIGVVVPLLRAPDLVAAEQHRRSLRERERGDEVALLPRAVRAHRFVAGRSLHAAVPAAVVVRAVAVALAVRVV